MNTEIKALVDAAFDIGSEILDVVDSKGAVAEITDAEALLLAIPPVVQNWPQLKTDIAGLAGTQGQADLAAYVLTKATGAGVPANANAALAAVIAWGEATYNLIGAVKAMRA